LMMFGFLMCVVCVVCCVGFVTSSFIIMNTKKNKTTSYCCSCHYEVSRW
jgi:cell division protein FtsW (lipid II flippase)